MRRQGNSILITRERAFASGHDAANRQMRKAWPRKKWSEADYAHAVETTNRLLTYVPFEHGGLGGLDPEMLKAHGIL